MKHLLTAGLICASSAVAASDLNISGSTTVATAIMDPYETMIEEQSGIGLSVVANGSSRGIADLVNGDSQIAMISAPLDVTIAKIEKKTPGALDGVELMGHQISQTLVSFVVHPSNPVQSMTLDQVSSILSGATTNWSDLGGPNMPIVVVAETLGGGVRTLVESELLDGTSIAGEVREFPNATQVPNVVSQLPPAFGVAAQGSVSGTAAMPVSTGEPISQPLLFVTIGEPSEAIQSVIEAARMASN